MEEGIKEGGWRRDKGGWRGWKEDGMREVEGMKEGGGLRNGDMTGCV